MFLVNGFDFLKVVLNDPSSDYLTYAIPLCVAAIGWEEPAYASTDTCRTMFKKWTMVTHPNMSPKNIQVSDHLVYLLHICYSYCAFAHFLQIPEASNRTGLRTIVSLYSTFNECSVLARSGQALIPLPTGFCAALNECLGIRPGSDCTATDRTPSFRRHVEHYEALRGERSVSETGHKNTQVRRHRTE